MRISDCISDVCSSDLEGNKAGYAQFGQQPLYVLHISQRHICHWVLGVAAFGTTAHFRTDKPPLPRQPVCHRLEVAGIPGEAGKTEYRRAEIGRAAGRGKSVSVRLDLGGPRDTKTKNKKTK